MAWRCNYTPQKTMVIFLIQTVIKGSLSRGASKAMTSQWSIYAHHLTLTFMSTTFHCFLEAIRISGQWQPGNTAYTCTDNNGNNMRWKFEILIDILEMVWLSFYWEEIWVPTHDAFGKYIETWEFGMRYSKTRWGYSLKAAIKLKKTSRRHFQWSLPLLVSWLKVERHSMMLYCYQLECIVESWPTRSAAAQFWQW